VADVDAVTDVVVTVNVAVVAPAGTVTLAGVAAALELSESDTAAPPVGAAALSVTVPVDELPPTTLVGLSDTAESVGPVAPCGSSSFSPRLSRGFRAYWRWRSRHVGGLHE